MRIGGKNGNIVEVGVAATCTEALSEAMANGGNDVRDAASPHFPCPNGAKSFGHKHHLKRHMHEGICTRPAKAACRMDSQGVLEGGGRATLVGTPVGPTWWSFSQLRRKARGYWRLERPAARSKSGNNCKSKLKAMQTQKQAQIHCENQAKV